MDELTHWSTNMQSQLLVTAEKKYLQRVVPTLRGYHLLLLGSHKALNWLPEHCLHAFTLSPTLTQFPQTHIQTNFETLPLRQASIDAAIAPYLLEYTHDALSLLSELSRVLIPEGRLIILGINRWHPWSWLNAPHSPNTLMLWRLKKLLYDLDFSIINITRLHYGAIYGIDAQKHIHAVTPLRPHWNKPLIEKAWQPTVRKAG
jgi:ubiquinone/menaquinone biosynthesis C-methylase UbiE